MQFITSELKSFIGKSKSIRTNNVLPILSYIKYENGVLTKTNLETYYSCSISTKDKGVFLLDEKIISAILKDANADTIKIEVSGKFVIVNGKTKFPSEDPINFPKAPESEDAKKVSLDENMMKSIGIFGYLTMNTDNVSNLSFVHLNSSGLFASNNFSFANVEFYADLPEVILSTEACGLLSIYKEVEFYSNGNYNFFSSGNDSIVFVKPEAKTPLEQFKVVIGASDKKSYCEFEKKDFIAFCDFANTVSPSLLPDCRLSVKDRVMKLDLNDTTYEITDSRDSKIVGSFEIESFAFNPKIFAAYLKAIPYNLLRFSPHTQKGVLSLWTIEDEQFNGILVGIII